MTKVHPTSGTVHFAEADSHRPLLLRAGTVLPVVANGKLPTVVNTANLRKTPIELWVLPSSSSPSASGELFFDDGESIDTVETGNYNLYEFKMSKCNLSIKSVHFGYQAPPNSQDILKVDTIKVALSSSKAINSDNLNVSIDGASNHSLKANIKDNTLNIRLSEAVDLLKSNKTVSIVFSNKNSEECFTH